MKRILLFLFLILACSTQVFASYISLQTSVSSKVVGDVLQVTVSAVNKGDESAYNVQAEVRVGGQKVLAERLQELEIGNTYKVSGSFNVGKIIPGQYPLIVVMHYADANMYPFSALNCQTFLYKTKDLPNDIFGAVKSTNFWKNGKLKLTLKNLADSTINAAANLITPRELTVEQVPGNIDLPAKGSKSVEFKLENFSALSGSSYQVFAISEYEKDGRHITTITPGIVKIVETQNILGISYIYLIAALVVLVLIFLAYQLGASFLKK